MPDLSWGETMSTPELLKGLLVTILCIQKELNGSDMEKIKAAQEAYRELLDVFYEDYQNIMARQQYDAAKDDPDYFIALIQLAYYYQGQAIFDSDGEQSILKPDWKLFTRI
jgi:hypothetical protein